MTKSEIKKAISRLNAIHGAKKSPVIRAFLGDLNKVVKGRPGFGNFPEKTSFIIETEIERLKEAKAILEKGFYGKRRRKG
jgi:hypothetical protein